MEGITVKNQIIRDWVEECILKWAHRAAEEEDMLLSDDEEQDILDFVCDTYCDKEPLYAIRMSDLMDGSVGTGVARKVEEILKNRAKIYGVEVTVNYKTMIYVKANSEAEATEAVENLTCREVADYVDDEPEEFAVYTTYEEGTVEEYGSDDYLDATDS